MTIFLNFTYFPGKGKGGGVEDFWQMLEKSPMHAHCPTVSGKGSCAYLHDTQLRS